MKQLTYIKKLVKVGNGYYLHIPKVFMDANDLEKKMIVRLIIKDLTIIEVEKSG